MEKEDTFMRRRRKMEKKKEEIIIKKGKIVADGWAKIEGSMSLRTYKEPLQWGSP